MTNKESLQKVIEKAIKNGLDFYGLFDEIIPCDSGDLLYDGPIEALIECKYLINSIIFSPEFGKAFWYLEKPNLNYLPSVGVLKELPKENNKLDDYRFVKSIGMGCIWNSKDWVEHSEEVCWQHHQLELLKEVQEGRNPLKYLEKFLEV